MDNNRIGYSPKINDPAFAKYIKDTNKWSGYFSLGLAFAAVLGFFINGEVSDDMENPESLYIGFVIGGMFLLIAFYQIASRNRSKTWDGTIIDKKVEKKRRHDKYQDCWREYLEYKVTIEAGNGRKHDLIAEDDDTKYNYYQIGDKVRRHKGLNSYEKYDKRRDAIIFCNACASLNDIRDDYCFRCKCPLLK